MAMVHFKIVVGIERKGYPESMTPSQQLPNTTIPKDKWWKSPGKEEAPTCREEPREGYPCPTCLLGELHYNGLFQLICDNCGRVAEAAVFT